MSEIDDKDIGCAALLMGIIGGALVTFAITASCINDNWQRDCIKHNAAEWHTNPDGSVIWQWKLGKAAGVEK